MGLNRIVTLFHSKLSTVGDGRASRSGSSRTSNGDSASERNEDFDSSTTMSLSSSVESLTQSSASSPGLVTHPGSMPVLDISGRRRDIYDNNNNTTCSGSNRSLNILLPSPPPPPQFVKNGFHFSETKVTAECNGSFEDVLLVLGTEGIGGGGGGVNGVKSSSGYKRNAGLSRRFSLKAKFSSDLDLYGQMNRGTMMMMDATDKDNNKLASSSSLLLQGGGRSGKKPSIWSSFRLPIRLIKGKQGIVLKHMVWRNRGLNGGRGSIHEVGGQGGKDYCGGEL